MTEETTTTLDGMFKRRFGDKLEDLVPDFADFAQVIPFAKRPKLGDDFRFPVRVKRAQGFTFSAGGSAFTLNAAVPGKSLPAYVSATSYVMREEVAYDVAASATSNDDAFGDAFDEIVRDMLNSMGFHRELFILYGQSSLGLTAEAGTSSASHTYTLSTASSAIGMWLQLDGASVDVYDPTLTTKRNSTGALVVSVPTLDTDGQTVIITLTGAAADNAAVQSGDAIVLYGWTSSSVSAGIDKIVTNTGSLFGINAADYPLWKGNTLSASSAEATMLLLTRAASIQVQRSGRKGKRLKAFCSFPTWNDLNNNAAALRRFANSTKAGLDIGSMDSITYYGPGVGIDITPSALVKNGELFMGEWDSVLRIGATDLSFTLPGSSPENPKFFKEMEDKAGFEMRGYWRQALIPKRPAALTKVSGIVNSTA
jgi:hypothetical protein